MRKFPLIILFLISSVNALDYTTVRITQSFYYDAQRAHISQKTIGDILRIFSWRIDFNKDLRKGDKFIIIGKKGSRPRAIVYIGTKKRIAVFSYIDKRGYLNYYNIHGKTLYPSFAKTPVKYSRISSKFTRRRFHPILKTYLSHRAVDYVANKGTPVHAVANGIIEYKKYMGALGNVVRIKHGNNYATVYAHLSKFSRGLKASFKVKKGQIIGFVGSTGRSTGPHLHYELHYKGIRRNPLTYRLPKQKKVAKSDLRYFRNRARNILRGLKKINKHNYKLINLKLMKKFL